MTSDMRIALKRGKLFARRAFAASWTLPFPAALLFALLISATSPPVARAQQAPAGQATLQLEWSDAEGQAAEYFAEGEIAFLTVGAVGLPAGNIVRALIEVESSADVDFSSQTVVLSAMTASVRVAVPVRQDALPEPRERVQFSAGLTGDTRATTTIFLTIPRHGYAVSALRLTPSETNVNRFATVEAELNADAPAPVHLNLRMPLAETDFPQRPDGNISLQSLTPGQGETMRVLVRIGNSYGHYDVVRRLGRLAPDSDVEFSTGSILTGLRWNDSLNRVIIEASDTDFRNFYQRLHPGSRLYAYTKFGLVVSEGIHTIHDNHHDRAISWRMESPKAITTRAGLRAGDQALYVIARGGVAVPKQSTMMLTSGGKLARFAFQAPSTTGEHEISVLKAFFDDGLPGDQIVIETSATLTTLRTLPKPRLDTALSRGFLHEGETTVFRVRMENLPASEVVPVRIQPRYSARDETDLALSSNMVYLSAGTPTAEVEIRLLKDDVPQRRGSISLDAIVELGGLILVSPQRFAVARHGYALTGFRLISSTTVRVGDVVRAQAELNGLAPAEVSFLRYITSPSGIRTNVRMLITAGQSFAQFSFMALEEGNYRLEIREPRFNLNDPYFGQGYLQIRTATSLRVPVQAAPAGRPLLLMSLDRDFMQEGRSANLEVEIENLAASQTAVVHLDIPGRDDATLSAATLHLSVEQPRARVTVRLLHDDTPEPSQRIVLRAVTTAGGALLTAEESFTVPRHGYAVTGLRVEPPIVHRGIQARMRMLLNAQAPEEVWAFGMYEFGVGSKFIWVEARYPDMSSAPGFWPRRSGRVRLNAAWFPYSRLSGEQSGIPVHASPATVKVLSRSWLQASLNRTVLSERETTVVLTVRIGDDLGERMIPVRLSAIGESDVIFSPSTPHLNAGHLREEVQLSLRENGGAHPRRIVTVRAFTDTDGAPWQVDNKLVIPRYGYAVTGLRVSLSTERETVTVEAELNAPAPERAFLDLMFAQQILPERRLIIAAGEQKARFSFPLPEAGRHEISIRQAFFESAAPGDQFSIDVQASPAVLLVLNDPRLYVSWAGAFSLAESSAVRVIREGSTATLHLRAENLPPGRMLPVRIQASAAGLDLATKLQWTANEVYLSADTPTGKVGLRALDDNQPEPRRDISVRVSAADLQATTLRLVIPRNDFRVGVRAVRADNGDCAMDDVISGAALELHEQEAFRICAFLNGVSPVTAAVTIASTFNGVISEVGTTETEGTLQIAAGQSFALSQRLIPQAEMEMVAVHEWRVTTASFSGPRQALDQRAIPVGVSDASAQIRVLPPLFWVSLQVDMADPVFHDSVEQEPLRVAAEEGQTVQAALFSNAHFLPSFVNRVGLEVMTQDMTPEQLAGTLDARSATSQGQSELYADSMVRDDAEPEDTQEVEITAQMRLSFSSAHVHFAHQLCEREKRSTCRVEEFRELGRAVTVLSQKMYLVIPRNDYRVSALTGRVGHAVPELVADGFPLLEVRRGLPIELQTRLNAPAPAISTAPLAAGEVRGVRRSCPPSGMGETGALCLGVEFIGALSRHTLEMSIPPRHNTGVLYFSSQALSPGDYFVFVNPEASGFADGIGEIGAEETGLQLRVVDRPPQLKLSLAVRQISEESTEILELSADLLSTETLTVRLSASEDVFFTPAVVELSSAMRKAEVWVTARSTDGAEPRETVRIRAAAAGAGSAEASVVIPRNGYEIQALTLSDNEVVAGDAFTVQAEINAPAPTTMFMTVNVGLNENEGTEIRARWVLEIGRGERLAGKEVYLEQPGLYALRVSEAYFQDAKPAAGDQRVLEKLGAAQTLRVWSRVETQAVLSRSVLSEGESAILTVSVSGLLPDEEGVRLSVQSDREDDLLAGDAAGGAVLIFSAGTLSRTVEMHAVDDDAPEPRERMEIWVRALDRPGVVQATTSLMIRRNDYAVADGDLQMTLTEAPVGATVGVLVKLNARAPTPVIGSLLLQRVLDGAVSETTLAVSIETGQTLALIQTPLQQRGIYYASIAALLFVGDGTDDEREIEDRVSAAPLVRAGLQVQLETMPAGMMIVSEGDEFTLQLKALNLGDADFWSDETMDVSIQLNPGDEQTLELFQSSLELGGAAGPLGEVRGRILPDEIPEPSETVRLLFGGTPSYGSARVAHQAEIVVPRNDYAVTAMLVQASVDHPIDEFVVQAVLNGPAPEDSTVRLTVGAFASDAFAAAATATLLIPPRASTGSVRLFVRTAGAFTLSISTALFTHSSAGDQTALEVRATSHAISVYPLLHYGEYMNYRGIPVTPAEKLKGHFDDAEEEISISNSADLCNEAARAAPTLEGRLPCFNVTEGDDTVDEEDAYWIYNYVRYHNAVVRHGVEIWLSLLDAPPRNRRFGCGDSQYSEAVSPHGGGMPGLRHRLRLTPP